MTGTQRLFPGECRGGDGVAAAELPFALSFPVVKNKSTFDYIKRASFQQGPEPPGRTQPVLQVEEAFPQVCLSLCVPTPVGTS